MSLYIIAVGGTGAKFVEALTHVAGAGLLGENAVRVLFVDPDEANGHINRAIETLATYQECYELLGKARSREGSRECPWLKTPIELFRPNLWSPLTGINRTLSSLFNYSNYPTGDPMRNLFDALYTDKEKDISLDQGFRGRPAIGSAVMSQVDNLTEPPWSDLFAQVKQDLGGTGDQDPRIFLCGSAFGGTGAAGFPTLGRLIANRLEGKDMNCRQNVKLGGVLLLPYFDFPVPGDIQNSNELYARPEDFLLNTEAALRYYRDQAQNIFDIIYLLGTPSFSPVRQFSLGKGEQRNPPHFIELYAALAVQHFLGYPPKPDGSPSRSSQMEARGKAVIIKRNHPERISWDDLPEGAQPQLLQTTRFAVTWVTDMDRALQQARQNFERFARLAPWAIEFFYHPLTRKELPQLEREVESLPVITKWCESYLQWLTSLHISSGSKTQVKLFNCNAFLDGSEQFKQQSAKLWELVEAATARDEKDTIARLKSQHLSSEAIKTEPKHGLVGLARALYIICQQGRR